MANTSRPRATRVLIVEDHLDAREMYEIWLGMAGIDTRGVTDADEGFDVAAEWQPDVIFTDFLLHGGPTGAELCARIHADSRTSHIPIVVMTGSTHKSHAEAAIGAGCAAIRLKPYLPDSMLEDIRRFTGSRASSVALTALGWAAPPRQASIRTVAITPKSS